MKLESTFCLRSHRVLKDGCPEGATILVEDGRIAAVEAFDAPIRGLPVIDVGDAVVMAGLVDTHVHINDPGRSHWEGFETATRAAAAGGITTVVDMPLNSSPVTTTAAALATKAQAAAGRCVVDYGFWGGIIPGNERDLLPLWQQGALGFKAFLVPSGLDEFPASGERELRAALRFGAEHGTVLLAHGEAPTVVEAATARAAQGDPHLYETYLASRPPRAEVEAIELLVALSRETGGAVHIVHVASQEALDVVTRARAEGLPMSAETCPHYLTFTAEEIQKTVATEPVLNKTVCHKTVFNQTVFKCAPPIREQSHREALWQGLLRGDLDLVATDHSPCPPDLKEGNFFEAWGGISSLQLLLPATWTEGHRRGAGLQDLARWLCRNPARLAGLGDHKGRIAPGYDADLTIWDPDRSWTVDGAALHHRHPLTPYQGRRLQGVVQTTILRGRTVYQDGQFPAPPQGKWIQRRGLRNRGGDP